MAQTTDLNGPNNCQLALGNCLYGRITEELKSHDLSETIPSQPLDRVLRVNGMFSVWDQSAPPCCSTVTKARAPPCEDIMATAPNSRPTTARRRSPASTQEFTQLSKNIRESGFLKRRYGYYWTKIIGLFLAFAATVSALVLFGDTWWQMITAAVLACVLTQIAFLGHDAAHRQIFVSGRWNDWISILLVDFLVGMSYGWWQHKHTRHHANPNKAGSDPDIELPVFAVTPEQSGRRNTSRLVTWVRGRQGFVFFPLLLLEGLSLHVSSVRRLASPGKLSRRWVEVALISVRLTSYVLLVFWILSPGVAAAFLGVQLALFGFYMGMAFAPNHMGMPIVPKDMRVDFLRRQVLMSRNIKGSRFLDTLMGGLNYQIEHHLFPSMPRPHLRQAAPVIAAYCRERNITYTRTSLFEAYVRVGQYINRVGLGQKDVFTCPLVQNRQAPGVPAPAVR